MGISDNPAWDFDWPGHRYLSEEQIWECTFQGCHAPGVAPSAVWKVHHWAQLKHGEEPKYPAYPDYPLTETEGAEEPVWYTNDACYRYDGSAEIWVSVAPWIGSIKHIFRSGRHDLNCHPYVAESEWTQWVPTREWGEYLAGELSGKLEQQFYVRREKNILLAEQKVGIVHDDISHDYVNLVPGQFWDTSRNDPLISKMGADIVAAGRLVARARINAGNQMVDLRLIQALAQEAKTHLLRRRTTHLPSISLAWKVTTVTPSEEKTETGMEDAMWLNLNRPFRKKASSPYRITGDKYPLWDGAQVDESYGESDERRYQMDSSGRMLFIPWRNLV